MILELLTALFIDSADKALGTQDETRAMLARSDQYNHESDAILYGIANSTNRILGQMAVESALIAEEMKNRNLSRLKHIQSERQYLLRS